MTADAVDSSVYYDFAQRYDVSGVPVTIVDGRLRQLGAAPAGRILALLQQADRLQGA